MGGGFSEFHLCVKNEQGWEVSVHIYQHLPRPPGSVKTRDFLWLGGVELALGCYASHGAIQSMDE
jgi:hypothetical protein